MEEKDIKLLDKEKYRLYALIHRMTRAEKRHFSLRLNKTGNDIYIKMFKAIKDVQSYNENTIIKLNIKIERIINTKDKKKIKDHKNFLYKKILKSIREHRVRNCTETEISILLDNAEILREKQLYDQSEKNLEKALELAQKYEKYTAQLDIYSRLITLNVERNSENRLIQVNEYYAEKSHVLERMNLKNRLRKIYHGLFIIYRQRNLDEKDREGMITQLAGELESIEIKNDTSFYTNFYYNYCYAFLHRNRNELREAHKYFEQAIMIWEQNEDIIHDQKPLYKIVFGNYLNICITVKDFEQVPKKLEKLRELQTDSLDEKAEDFQSFAFVEHRCYMNWGKWDMATEVAEDIENKMEEYASKLNDARKISIHYNLACFYFLVENFKKAYAHLQQIIKMKHTEDRSDLQKCAIIFQHIVLFELVHGTKFYNREEEDKDYFDELETLLVLSGKDELKNDKPKFSKSEDELLEIVLAICNEQKENSRSIPNLTGIKQFLEKECSDKEEKPPGKDELKLWVKYLECGRKKTIKEIIEQSK